MASSEPMDPEHEPMDPEHEPMDPEHDQHYENELTKLMEATNLESKIKILTESPRVIPPNVRDVSITKLPEAPVRTVRPVRRPVYHVPVPPLTVLMTYLKKRITKKPVFTAGEGFMIFNTTMEKLRENGEADVQTNLLINCMNIETKPCILRSELERNYYREILCNLDYLDCVGLDLVDYVKQGMTSKLLTKSIEPFSGQSVRDFVEWMKDCKIIVRKTRSTKWGSISSMLQSVYTLQSISMFHEKVRPNIIDHSIRCAIESENYILVSELVRKYLYDHDFQLQRVFEDIKDISAAITNTILQTVQNMILRKFPILQNNSIVLSVCLECADENRLVMIMSYRGDIEVKDKLPNNVMGFELILYKYTQPSAEASFVFRSIPVSKSLALPAVTEYEAREFFRKHSNLTKISASPYKSMGYSKGKHRIVEKPCISLFCLHKGYIPYGEELFPKHIGEFEVDVQEGYSVLGSDVSLDIGGSIWGSGCGSIGGFVDLPNNKTGLITCAHVIFSSKQLEELELNGIPPRIKVGAFDRNNHTYRECGTCVDAKFPKCFRLETPSQTASQHPNVDAALIELNPAIDTFRLRTVSSDQLYSAGFDPFCPPVFAGEAVPLSELDPLRRIDGKLPGKSDSVVKYGVETGLTIGNLFHSGVHVRFHSESLKLPDKSRNAMMCDQIEIQNLPQGQFFECGDSGSFVFCINPDKTLSCLGMAVGLSLPQKFCLVTPIDRILSSVCPPGTRLKPCSSLTQQTNAPSQATLDRILAAVEGFQTSLQNVQTSLQNVERNVESNSQRLQNIETYFQKVERNSERNVQANNGPDSTESGSTN